MRHSLLLPLLVAGAAPLAAQSMAEALARVPADAVRVETYRDASVLDGKVQATLGRVAAPPKDFSPCVYRDLGVKVANQPEGPVLEVAFAGKTPKSELLVSWVPAKNFKAFARTIKAKPAGKQLQVKRGKATYWVAAQGDFAVVAPDRDLLRRVLAAPGGSFTVLAPWLESHDLGVAGAPGSVGEFFKGVRDGIQGAGKTQAGANPAATKAWLLPLVDQAEASVAQAAFSLDFPTDGSLRMEAKVFFRADSPLARLCGTLTPSATHALEGLAPAGSVLAAGGPSIPGLAKLFQAQPGVTETQAALVRNQTGYAFSLGLPPANGPVLGGLRWLVRLNDVPAYFQQARELVQAQAPNLAALGVRLEQTPDVLPGVPSFSQTFHLEGKSLAGLPMAQVKMLATLLVGSGDQATLSVGQADPHTVVGVLGDAQALKAALAGYGPGFAADRGVAAVDELLPAGGWRVYLDPANARTLAANLMEAFTGKPAAFPELAPVPPMALVVRADASGIALHGALTPQTLDAVVTFFHQVTPKPAAQPEQ